MFFFYVVKLRFNIYSIEKKYKKPFDINKSKTIDINEKGYHLKKTKGCKVIMTMASFYSVYYNQRELLFCRITQAKILKNRVLLSAYVTFRDSFRHRNLKNPSTSRNIFNDCTNQIECFRVYVAKNPFL